jgi:hypothetical protein
VHVLACDWHDTTPLPLPNFVSEPTGWAHCDRDLPSLASLPASPGCPHLSPMAWTFRPVPCPPSRPSSSLAVPACRFPFTNARDILNLLPRDCRWGGVRRANPSRGGDEPIAGSPSLVPAPKSWDSRLTLTTIGTQMSEHLPTHDMHGSGVVCVRMQLLAPKHAHAVSGSMVCIHPVCMHDLWVRCRAWIADGHMLSNASLAACENLRLRERVLRLSIWEWLFAECSCTFSDLMQARECPTPKLIPSPGYTLDNCSLVPPPYHVPRGYPGGIPGGTPGGTSGVSRGGTPRRYLGVPGGTSGCTPAVPRTHSISRSTPGRRGGKTTRCAKVHTGPAESPPMYNGRSK